MRIFDKRNKNKTTDNSNHTSAEEIELKTFAVIPPVYTSNLLELPKDVISNPFTYLEPIEILRVSITCRLFHDCALDNTVWIGFLTGNYNNKNYDYNFNFIFTNSPLERASRFLFIGKKGFDSFAEQMKYNIASAMHELQANMDQQAPEYTFEFKGTAVNLMTTLSDIYVQKLVHLNVISLNYIYGLSDQRRENISRNKNEGLLERLERNRGNEALRNDLRENIKKAENNTPIFGRAHEEQNYMQTLALYK